MASALDAATDDRMAAMREDKCQKQKQRYRLTADPLISVTALMSILVNFLKYKETKDLESCVEPPPSGPVSYGWHSAPAPDWLVKASALLYDLLGICKNSKVNGIKMRKALDVLHRNRDLELRINKKHSAEDCIDRLDFQIRVLLNMVRNLRSSSSLRMKAWRCLGRAEQVRLDLVLDRCILPPELVGGDGEVDLDLDEEKIQNLDTLPVPQELVPLPPPEVPQTRSTAQVQPKVSSGKGNGGLLPMPAVFGQVLYGNKAPLVAPSALVASPKVVAKAKQEGGKAKKPTAFDASTMFSCVLQKALDHTPAASLKKPKAAPKKPKEKKETTKSKKKKTKKAKKQTDKKEKIKVEEAKSSQGKKKKKQQAKVESGAGKDSTKSEVAEVEYKPGEMRKEQEIWVKAYLEKEEMKGNVISKAEANKKWLVSLRRAQILCHVPLHDLKRRRFVPKGVDYNPFLALVNAQGSEDVD
eukprot:s5233_g1.t1